MDVSTLTAMIPGLKASMEGSCPDERESKRERLRESHEQVIDTGSKIRIDLLR